MLIEERYSKNISSFSEQEIISIHSKKVCIVGCGGLGGHVIETLARFGIHNLSIVDGDVFSVGNLNRQVFCTEKNIGKFKVDECAASLKLINSNVKATKHCVMIDEENVDSIINNCDVVFDCLDNAQARLLLEKACSREKIVLIHGAIAGFLGQVTTVFPFDNTIATLYANKKEGVEKKSGCPSFTPQLVASIQCCEGIKVLLGRTDTLKNKLLYIDLLTYNFETIDINLPNKTCNNFVFVI